MGLRPRKEKEDFFKGIASYCGFSDISSVQRFYYALIRHLLMEMKNKGQVYLPEFGEIIVRTMKGKKMHHAYKRETIEIGERKMIKFEACGSLKSYFKNKP